MEGFQRFQNDFYKVCRDYKDKVAITYLKSDNTCEEYTYHDMEQKVLYIVEQYKKLEIERGDRIAVMIPLSPEAYMSIIALAYMGATSVIPDINLSKDELNRLLINSDIQQIVTVPYILDDKLQNTKYPVINACDNWKIIRKGEITHPVDVDYEAIAILFSSGTTSQAKGVVIGYEQELNALDRLLEVVGTNEIRYLMLFPNSHISGLTSFLVLLLRGGQIATMQDASATKILQAFHIYKPNTFGMVPKVWETFYNKIEDGIRAKGKFMSEVLFRLINFCGKLREKTGINIGRLIFKGINKKIFGGELLNAHSGGGKSNVEVAKFFWNMGFDWYDFYASTEGNIPITVTNGNKFMDGVGDITANSNTSIRIYNPNKNGVGEILVKNNTMMRGYFREPQTTKEAFCDEWFRTGDIGKIEKNQLYILGRIKESIHLQNGEKISPDDVERIYSDIIDSEIEFAACGITAKNTDYDELYIFVKGSNGQFNSDFKRVNQIVNSNYRYSKLIYIDDIPKTSVGKVKRYELKKFLTDENGKTLVKYTENDFETRNFKYLKDILRKYISVEIDYDITKDMRLQEDLGFDSLSMFQICLDIESIYKTDISEKLDWVLTVDDLYKCIVKNEYLKNEDVQYNKYPVIRTNKLDKKLHSYLNLIRKIYKLNVSGIENIPKGKCIISSNHTSNLDPLWILSAIGENNFDINKIATLAAMHTLKENKNLFNAIGGIPVIREKNTTPAMRRVKECLLDGYSVIIFPEGARSRDGSMLPFHNGVAMLAKETNTPIIPVKINGGFEIFPRYKKYPSLFDWKHLKKYELIIEFGKPILSNKGEVTYITSILKDTIERM